MMLIFLLLPFFNQAGTLEIEPHNHSWGHLYSLHDDNKKKVAYSASYELPLLGCFVIHSLYVPPQERQKGYGQEILELMIDKYQKQGYSWVYIQVGPYERGEYLDEGSDDYAQRIKRLCMLYSKVGFEPAPWYEQQLASSLYPLLGIRANPQYLMRKAL